MPINSALAVFLALASPALGASAAGMASESAAPADGMKHIASLKNWADVLQDFKLLPSNVQKQTKAALQDVSFPDVRFVHAGLIIRQSDGRQAKVVLGKHGKAFINGKLWKADPLASPSDEISRIDNVLESGVSRLSVLDALIPTASAAGFSSAAGFIYSTSTAWKAKSCSEDQSYTDEQNHDCPLMGVAYKIPEPVKLGSSVQIGLKCPKTKDDGNMVMFTKSRQDATLGVSTTTYVKGVLKKVDFKALNPDGSSHSQMTIDGDTVTDPKLMNFFKNLGALVESERTDVCGGSSSVRQDFMAKLAANKASFETASSASEPGSDTSMQ